MTRAALLFFVIFLEGYVVLSAELLAIRQTIPFVGSGTDTISIIIAAVLMPLAFGYYAGGQYRGAVRRKLIKNLLLAMVFLTVGLSYILLDELFETLIQDWGLKNRLWLVTIYASVFIVYPVYLLGQTVPLLTNYFPRARLSEAAGKILFFSTLGSFLGAVFTTLFLMNTIGVAHTVTVTIGALGLLIVIMAKRLISPAVMVACCLFVMAAGLNSDFLLIKKGIVASNTYNTVQITESGTNVTVRQMLLNGIPSSALFPDKPGDVVYRYVDYIESVFIKKFQSTGETADILILGSGGFTLGLTDSRNNYTFVDIDPDLKEVTEEHFLKAPLGDNKEFIAEPARSYLKRAEKKYDLVVMDIAQSISGVPEQLLTREYFESLAAITKESGITIIHMHAALLFETEFSRVLDNTIRSVFPYATRQIVTNFNPWDDKRDGDSYSILYVGKSANQIKDNRIFTDNLNIAPTLRNQRIP